MATLGLKALIDKIKFSLVCSEKYMLKKRPIIYEKHVAKAAPLIPKAGINIMLPPMFKIIVNNDL